MSKSADKVRADAEKLVSSREFIAFMACAFFFTNMQGMVNGYRQAYLVNVLRLGEGSVATINGICSVAGFALSFFYAMIVDRAPKPGKAKFKPLVLMTCVPAGVFAVLMYYTPGQLSDLSVTLMTAYQVAVTLLYNASTYFAGTFNHIAVVISPNQRERDKVISFRGIASAIGNSAPLVVVLVIGLLRKPGIITTEAMMYIVSAALCAAVGTLTLLLAMRTVKERVAYSPKPQNPLLGYLDVLKNRHAWLLLASEFIKGFRGVSTYMEVFLVVALLNDPAKKILLLLPTGIGTFVGMLIVSALLKRFNSRQIYMASGVYSILANICAFSAGLASFRHPGEIVYQIVFFAFLFLIGLQFGASNILPSMFQADVLEDLEAKTHKRLEASLGLTVSLGSTASGTIVQILGPLILYGASALNFIHYKPPMEQIIDGVKKTVYLDQDDRTKIMLLAVFTFGQGIFMLLCAAPFLFYRLTGERKAKIHEKVLAYRAELEQAE
ncbi:MAG: MFS transporter [Oscillospiraceae bacterium]|nr:MFS transporter [Oscillospiraceae bacterium]